MNNNLLSAALTDIDEQFIAEARAERIKPGKHSQMKYFISSVACACAVILAVSLPIALSRPDNPALPPQIGTETPPTGTQTPPVDINPPTVDIDKPYIESGYVINGAGEPISPLMLAYKINREFDEGSDLSIQLSFGMWGLDYYLEESGAQFSRVVIGIEDSKTRETYVLKELTAAEFFVPEYDVKVKCTIEENEEGELVTTSETRIFKNEETFIIPSSIFSRNAGGIVVNISAFDGDELWGGSGDEFYYIKLNGKINILTYREYQSVVNP